MNKGKAIKIAYITLKAIIYSLVPVVFLMIITSNTSLLFGIRSFVVQTGSMEPKVHVGSVIFSIPQKTYDINDIILFKDAQSRTIAHRVVQTEIKNGQIFYVTKGDANNVADLEITSENQILGREFVLIPSVGKISNFIKTVPGFLILLGLPTLIFIGFELLNIKNELEKDIELKLREKLGVSI